MKKTKLLTTGLASVAAVALWAGTAQAEVVGYNRVSVPQSSDAVLSVPFNRSASDAGTVTSAADSTHFTDTSASWIAGEWTNTPHYVRLTSGSSNGKWSTILNNTTDTLTLATGVAVMPGDTYRIEEHRTLGNTFPAWLEGTSFIASAGTAGSARRTEVRLVSLASAGVNRSPGGGGTYYYLTNGFWRSTASSSNAKNTILPPQQYFVVRNQNTNTTLNVYTLGEVTESQLATIAQKETVPNDNPLSSDRPVPMSLAELDLAGTPAFTSSLSGSGGNRRDEIRLFTNGAVGLNKAPGGGGTYYHRSDLGYWVSTATGTANVSTNKVIQPGEGFVIRRYQGTASPDVWSHNATY